jgi:nucleoside-diphosphate-sugar epimerase
MRVLVTGGTGVVGTSTVTELLKRGHEVVLVSRHAADDARQWPTGVTPKPGDVSERTSIAGSAEGCDLVLHMVAIVEQSSKATFDAINVEGTRNMLAEADRARVGRFIFVSSLGAATGESEYHRSKREAEALVKTFSREWTICRPGNVYGPGDEQISVLLRMVRSPSPVVPVIGDGDQPIQPLWHEDAARAIAEIVERKDLNGRELDLAGAEVTSQNDLLKRLQAITGQEVTSLPLPDFVASLGARAISMVGWDIALSDDQVQMISEGNCIRPGGVNALTEVLHVTPTPLDQGLRALADAQPEQLPREGIGSLKRKLFWADIVGSDFRPEALFQVFRTHFNEVTPVYVDAKAEPQATTTLLEGESITLALPMRGHVQVRVAGLEARQVTLLTLAGHPLAGAVRFLSEQRGDAVRFRIEVYDRAANLIDLIAMRTIGDRLQDRTWMQVVENVIARSGGSAPAGVQHESESLDDDEAERIQEWLEELTVQQKREENAGKIFSEPAR